MTQDRTSGPQKPQNSGSNPEDKSSEELSRKPSLVALSASVGRSAGTTKAAPAENPSPPAASAAKPETRPKQPAPRAEAPVGSQSDQNASPPTDPKAKPAQAPVDQPPLDHVSVDQAPARQAPPAPESPQTETATGTKATAAPGPALSVNPISVNPVATKQKAAPANTAAAPAKRPDQQPTKPAPKPAAKVAVKAIAPKSGKRVKTTQPEKPARPAKSKPAKSQASKASHLAPVPQPDKPEPPAAAHPEAERIRARAQMLNTLASLIGVPLSVSDLSEQLQAAGERSLRNETMVDVLLAAGLRAQLAPIGKPGTKPSARSWPAIAIMQGGQPILVLEQTKAGLVIFDTTCADNRAEVPLQDFMPYFTGQVLTARPSLSQLTQRHTPHIDMSHWFWGEFPKYRRQIGEIMLGSLVANVLAVAVALFSLQVYDRVVPHQSQATLWVLAIGALLAICLEGILKVARAQITDAAGRQVDLAVQRKLMQRLIGLRVDQKPLPPSGLFSAMRDFSSVREFFTSSTLSTLADVPFIGVFLLLVASIGGPVVWVIILGGVLMLLPGYFLQKRMIALTRQTQGASTKSARLLHEVVSELETIKTQRGEDRVLRLWDELNLLSSQASNGQRRLASALTYWSQGVQQATYIGAVILGTFMVFAGEFTVGTIIATGILTSRTLAPLTQFAGTLARWSNVRAALDALDALAEAPQEHEPGRAYLRRDKIEGGFELREVVFRYDPEGAPNVDVPAVAITPGQRVAVLGANGSGKSTLLKLFSGLYSPEKGRVMLDGTDMSQIEPRDLRRHIGYLGQDVRLFAGTLRDNLNLTMLERDDSRLMDALDFAGIGAFVRAHPRGLDLPIGDNGAGLSIGQRQSIGWARLWLQDPTVVLLDEPTAALDQTLERTLVSRLESWLGTRTAIVATHRMPILALTNRTLILQSGRMVVDGPKEEVMAHLNAGNKA